MTLQALSRYLLRSQKAADVRAAELYRREVAIAELQDFIFINDTRTYSEHSNRARLGLAYIKEHWAEIMDELKAASENEHKRTRHEQ